MNRGCAVGSSFNIYSIDYCLKLSNIFPDSANAQVDWCAEVQFAIALALTKA